MITLSKSNLYRYYNATFTASANTNDGIVQQIFNDDFSGRIFGTLTWTSTGTYQLTNTSSLFVQNLSCLFITPMFRTGITLNSNINWEWKDATTFTIRTYNSSTGALANTGFLINLEYRLYNNYVYSVF